MAETVLSMWQARASTEVQAIFDRERWDAALREQVALRNRLTANDFGRSIADELDAGFDSTALDGFILTSAGLTAVNMNDALQGELERAMGEEDRELALTAVLAILVGSTLDRLAESTVTTSANFGMTTAADQAGMQSKVWVVNSARPRSEHAQLNGEAVGFGEPFSNGMQWPGDPAGGAENNANCQCSVDFE